MTNPWLDISLADYEGHMALPEVAQATLLGGIVTAVCRGMTHSLSKPVVDEIRLIAGLGIAGDAHCGATIQHRSRVAVDPQQPNLRQVHLLHAELHDELQAAGFRVSPGTMGENITTRGIELLALPAGTELHVGDQAVVELTGLRTPCVQLDAYQAGLMAAVLDRDGQGRLICKAGIMGIVRCAGTIRVARTPDCCINSERHVCFEKCLTKKSATTLEPLETHP